jgi:predicted Zn finger-like uncharacterized protein
MSIKVSCPKCGQGYNLSDAQRGKKVRCKECAEVFEARPDEERTVPAVPRAGGGAGKRADPDARGDEERPRKRPALDEDDRPRRRPARSARDEDEDDRPRRRGRDDEDDYDYDDERPRRKSKKAKGGIPLWVWLVGGGGVGFVMLLGASLVVWLVFFRFNPVTMENYDKIKAGSTEADVLALLGSPSQTSDAGRSPAFDLGGLGPKAPRVNMPNMKTMVWKRGDDVLCVGFMNGKIFMKVIKVGNTTKWQTL